jgi:dimethylhistidine N-methyltransferase
MSGVAAATAMIRTALRVPSSGPPGEHDRFRREVLEGLDRPRRALPSVWFYDVQGSRLFQRIMQLPGYYPTRLETGIFERHAEAMLAALPDAPAAIVDLGAGDGAKTGLLVAAARGRSAGVLYAPVDLSAEALDSATARMGGTWPDLGLLPVQGDYVAGLAQAARASGPGPLLALLLGSNLGNLEWPAAVGLLRSLRRALRPGDHLLIGLDLLKEVAVLDAAYDDPDGVTAAFNLNLLARVNREMGGDFDLGGFSHRATFDPGRPAMVSWLVSSRRQVVTVAGRRFQFEAGEAIHTEISWKYTEAQVGELALQAGFDEVARFCDERRWFADALWSVGRREDGAR